MRGALKTFRITEQGNKGRVLVREVRAKSIDDIDRGATRLISIEMLDDRGNVARIWPKRTDVHVLSQSELEALRKRIRELPGANEKTE
jgi:hypothetical protein